MARTKGAKNVVKQAEQPKNDSSKTKGKAINEQEVVTSVTRDKGKKIVGRSVPIVSEAGNLMVVGEPSQRSIELRTKHRNDPLVADFKKAMIEGVSRKRKVNGSTKQNVGVVIGGGEDIPAHDVLENPAAAKKKTRHEKRKEALVNYKQVVVKPASAYASLFTRTTSCALFKAIGQMNDLQQYSVGRLGFDEILELTIKDIPGRLSYFVLDSFDRRRCDITLPNGQTIPVTEDDVHRVLGFPKGFKKIKLIDSTQTTPLCEEWKQCFPNTHPKKIKITEVKDAMLAHEDGSKWFKIHFMVMLTHCLIESTSNGCVFPRMIKCLEDLNSVSQWNWCEFVIRSLIENHVDWENDTATTFVGPTLFLTVFYVDRVRWANSDIRRDFPLIKNWSTKLLKKRENVEIAANGFGVGVVVGPIDVETAIARAAKQKEIGDDGEGAPVDESLAMKITHFKIARDALITVVNAAVPQDPESNTLEFEEAKRLLLSAPIVSTSLPVEKIKEGSNGVNVDHMTPEKTTNIGEGADHMTPENPADVLEDYCLGMTQLGNEAMTSNTVTGDGNVGINTETEYHFQDSGAVDVVRDTTSLDDAVGLKDAMPTVELPIKGTAAGKITGENAEDLGCQMDVAATTEDFTFATTPQVGIIVEQPENVGVQGQRRARTNLTRVRLPTGKENVSFENPTVLVKKGNKARK